MLRMRMAKSSEAAEEAADAARVAARAARKAAEALEGDAEPVKLGPIFALKGDKAEAHEKTRVYRDEPVDEGYVGDIPPEGTQEDIRRRWGGGIFHLQAVDSNGAFLKQLSGVKIAGEPIFDNGLAAKKYRRWLTSNFSDATPAAAPGRTVEETIALEEARHRRELERIRAEADAALARAKVEAEARREDELARQARQQEWFAIQTKQQQDFMATMAKIHTEAGGGGNQIMETLASLALQRLAGGDGGGPSDPVTAFLARGPEILQELRKTGAAIGAERNPRAAGNPAAAGGLTITGPLANKLRRLVGHLQNQGVDPETALDAAMSAMLPAAPRRRPPAKVAARPRPAVASRPPTNGKAAPPAARPPGIGGQRASTKPAAPGA
jgi:hypothetical protein